MTKNRRFDFAGETWEVHPHEMGHGVAAGRVPRITTWGVTFTCVSDPNRDEYMGTIGARDPGEVSEEALKRELARVMVLSATEESEKDWLTVEEIAQATGLDPKLVKRTMDRAGADFLQAPQPDAEGRTLFTTWDRYEGRTGFWKRYFDVLDSSST